jgi:hypothetical protein
VRRLAAPLLIALTLGACGSSTASPTPAPTLATTPPPTAALPTATGSASPAGSVAPVVDVDENLLDLLPATVAGIVVTSDPVTAAGIATDPALAANASAIAVAIAVAPGGSSAEDLAVASVVELRPGVYGDAFYRDWRDSYDTAACETAGGVSGHAEAEIGGHHTYIGTCAGGAHTYHVYLEKDDAIVSVTSVGELRLGEQVIAGLRP